MEPLAEKRRELIEAGAPDSLPFSGLRQIRGLALIEKTALFYKLVYLTAA